MDIFWSVEYLILAIPVSVGKTCGAEADLTDGNCGWNSWVRSCVESRRLDCRVRQWDWVPRPLPVNLHRWWRTSPSSIPATTSSTVRTSTVLFRASFGLLWLLWLGLPASHWSLAEYRDISRHFDVGRIVQAGRIGTERKVQASLNSAEKKHTQSHKHSIV